jgi:hypothetical protein
MKEFVLGFVSKSGWGLQTGSTIESCSAFVSEIVTELQTVMELQTATVFESSWATYSLKRSAIEWQLLLYFDYL